MIISKVVGMFEFSEDLTSKLYYDFSFFFQVYLYEKDTKSVSYSDFVNKELILFSNADNERSIPCLVDGKLWFLVPHL